MLILRPQPLAAAGFARFGTVIEMLQGAAGRPINAGTSQRVDLIDDLQLSADSGRPMLAVFRAQARSFPLMATELECHRHGSQTFIPLTGARFVVLVAPPAQQPSLDAIAAFVSSGRQGVSLAPGTWHHALLALDAGDFAVIERAADEPDCTIMLLPTPVQLRLDRAAPAAISPPPS